METLKYDPRFARLPLMDSPGKIALICLAYLAFVKILGPAWMMYRKPYNLRGPLIAHNFFLVILSTYMFYKYGKYGWFGKYSLTCENIDFSETEDSLEVVTASWLFLLSKFPELIDTVFFILRKKDSQVTFLHVIHHATVPLLTWFDLIQGATHFGSLFGFLNSFVHIWMYLYYGLAALGPSIQKYLWWKKYLTRLQILQFCIMTLASISVMVTPGCTVPAPMIAVNLGTALFFLVLFANFYRNSYKSQRKTKSSVNGADRKLFINPEAINNDSGNKKFF